ncbi:dTDP-glucose 4,6-dehydratase [Geminocystis sp. NIES-3708]|uniref:dTDP-glucose 4,6-dehydratase n=1 Tax=Geminocystis sp. NIES-3708 TaxID=1615909 RepID=UPI0005FCCE8E|nr:dTDP-glucose 4,6-dehydratase [Geminocystis sp. NIES-3708]BAQ62339.1 dTDP-glucose 4,6-dehydratase [Geminocystis sp. NIES-3708]
MSKHLLVTGGAGFIGSNFVNYWYENHPQDKIIVLDALTYAGNRQNLINLENNPNFSFIHGDICDRQLVDNLLEKEKITTIAHFAAESHVDRSILTPSAFIQTNVIGTFTLLESFRHYWQKKNQPPEYRFLHVSTDEVYGSLDINDPPFTENTPYAPNSPYSASKAGSDHLARAYYHTYKLPTIITNCSNNYGAYHFPEKLIPLMCINILLGKPLPVYGDGQNIRDWLYVQDHCSALDVVLNKGKSGETYNIGGNNEVKNIDLVQLICQIMDEIAPNLPIKPSNELITYVKDRAGHDHRYAIDSSKLQKELGWKPKATVESGLRKTLQWYVDNPQWWQSLLSADYQKYYQQVYTTINS